MAEPLEQTVSFWERNGPAAESLGVYALGILAYALVVNAFYQIISRRVMFGGTKVRGKQRLQGPMFGFGQLFLFPLVSFAFFLLLSTALLFLGGEQSPTLSFTTAMAVVLAVRAAAYINEATSHDVAKMLPLGLLGVILIRADLVDLVASLQRLSALYEEIALVGLYLGVVIVCEYLFRIVWMISRAIRFKNVSS